MTKMRTEQVTIGFSTALTAEIVYGVWTLGNHQPTAKFYESVMAIDGVTGIEYNNYQIMLTYRADIITRDSLIEAVADVIAELADAEGYFPRRGDKRPTIRLTETAASCNTDALVWHVASATFDTDLYDPDSRYMASVVAQLERFLADVEGVGHAFVGPREFRVCFDASVTSPNVMLSFVQYAVRQVTRPGGGWLVQSSGVEFFPNRKPNIVLKTRATGRPI